MVNMTDQESDGLTARLTDSNTPLPAPREVQTGAAAEAAGRDSWCASTGRWTR